MPRLHIRIAYPIDHPEKYELKTDIKKDKVAELLGNWLSLQEGKGEDNSVAVDREVYNIAIDFELEDDSFYMKSDTGNAGLTTGIVMDVVNRLQ